MKTLGWLLVLVVALLASTLIAKIAYDTVGTLKDGDWQVGAVVAGWVVLFAFVSWRFGSDY